MKLKTSPKDWASKFDGDGRARSFGKANIVRTNFIWLPDGQRRRMQYDRHPDRRQRVRKVFRERIHLKSRLGSPAHRARAKAAEARLEIH
jgi:hypothetical protein